MCVLLALRRRIKVVPCRDGSRAKTGVSFPRVFTISDTLVVLLSTMIIIVVLASSSGR